MFYNSIVFTASLGELAEVPGTPFAYWAPRSLRELFKKFPPLDRDVARQPEKPKIADVKVGLQTSDDLRFTHFWWEVPVEQIATSREETLQGKKWVPFAKGGRPFYHDVQLVVNWGNNGEEIKNYREPGGRQRSRPQNEAFYFRPGLAWQMNPQTGGNLLRRIAFYAIREGIILAVSVSGVFLCKEEASDLLALLNSTPTKYLILLMGSDKDISVGYVAKIPCSRYDSLRPFAREAHDSLREWATGDETATVFIAPWILQVWWRQNGKTEADLTPVTAHPLARDFAWSEWESTRQIREALCEAQGDGILRPLAQACVRWEERLRRRLDEIQQQIDDEVYRLYGISEEDRALIEAELGQSVEVEGEVEEEIEAAEETEAEEAAAQIALPAEEHIRRLIHYLAHEAIKEDPDGIVPLYDTYTTTGEFERGLPFRVRAKLQELFGMAAMPSVEQELRETLGKILDEWLATDFFSYHTGLYRLRPIIWQIASRPRGVPAFGCFVYWHKLDTDTLRKVQEVYLRPALEGAQREAERLAAQYAQKKAAGAAMRELREAERAWRQAEERAGELRSLSERIQRLFQPQRLSLQSRSAWVVEKVNEIMAQGYRPNRDYGVRVNIEPLKQAGILTADAARVKG